MTRMNVIIQVATTKSVIRFVCSPTLVNIYIVPVLKHHRCYTRSHHSSHPLQQTRVLFADLVIVMMAMHPRVLWFAAVAARAKPFSLTGRLAFGKRADYSLSKNHHNERMIIPASRLFATSKNNDQNENDLIFIEDKTLNWLKQVVIGLNLCPFADLPLRREKIKVDVIRGSDEEKIMLHVTSELLDRCSIPGTTLVVCPDLYPNNFQKYMEVVNVIEHVIMPGHNDELVGKVQVAPFHPLFQFDGSDPDDIDNYTNRSPYPIFHILREDEVAQAVDQLDGDAGKVWKRNIALLEAIQQDMGADTFQQILKGDLDERSGLWWKRRDLLQRFRLQFGSQKQSDAS